MASSRRPTAAPRIEAEIVFVLGEQLKGPGMTVAEAGAAISGAVAGLEIVDFRIVDWRIKLADTVADLASNGAMVTSSRVVPVTDVDTLLIGMVLTRGGELIAIGAGRPRSATRSRWWRGWRTPSARTAWRSNQDT